MPPLPSGIIDSCVAEAAMAGKARKQSSGAPQDAVRGSPRYEERGFAPPYTPIGPFVRNSIGREGRPRERTGLRDDLDRWTRAGVELPEGPMQQRARDRKDSQERDRLRDPDAARLIES